MKQINYLKTLLCLGASIALIGCSGTRYNRSTGQYLDDKAVAARVKSALIKDSMVKANDVKVQSFRGNVHLTGFVDHPAQKERAGQLTRNVNGVGWFKNDIVVKEALPGEAEMARIQQIDEPAGASRETSHQQSFRQQSSASTQSEGWQRGALNVYDPAATISARPSSSIRGSGAEMSGRASTSSSSSISSEPAGSDNSQFRAQTESSRSGRITLQGTVNSEDQKRMIEDQLKNIQGVSGVNNELEVQNR